eukprot:8885375-Prorocentrum_lima.AAC.1
MGKNRSRPELAQATQASTSNDAGCFNQATLQAPVKRMHGHVRAIVVGCDRDSLVDLHGSGGTN